MVCGVARQKVHRIILSIYCENLIIFFFLLLFCFCFLFLSFSYSSQMDKMPTDFLEIINKTITVGITDDLFSDTEKAQIIDDYSEWINKNNDEMATGYVICTCYMRFGPSLSIATTNIRCIYERDKQTHTLAQKKIKIRTRHSIYVAFPSYILSVCVFQVLFLFSFRFFC